MCCLCYANFGKNVAIVFDGPEQTVNIAIRKDEFNKNIINIINLIQNITNLFFEILVNEGFKTVQAPDDADTLIARTALSYSKEKQVKVMEEDADILVLLWHYVNKDVHEVMFQSESRTWNIQHLIDKTGHMKESILLTHAFLVCDTVSKSYDISKDKILKPPKVS